MRRQLSLFSEVLHAYSAEHQSRMGNAQLYQAVVERAGLDGSLLEQRSPVGVDGVPHNLVARKIRWHQQTLKHAGIIERVPGTRGVWQLTHPASKDLNQIQSGVSVVGFSTDLGVAILGACETVFSAVDAPITLCLTSPPYPLAKERQYGNPSEAAYVDWICKTIEPVVKNLVSGGSLCMNISNDIFLPGANGARSLYCERLLLALHDRLGLSLMDRLVWHNPSKPPGPVRWASVERKHLNVAWEPVYWLTNNPKLVRADNRRVLQAHTEKQLKLIRAGGEQRDVVNSDGAYRIKPGSYGNETSGRIPRNVLQYGHRCQSQLDYKAGAKATGLPAHGAPMPLALASFLVDYLSGPDDLVVDPFAGSFTTALAAERLGRRWLSTEVMLEYVAGAALRFEQAQGFNNLLAA